jgi:gliding motility-associated-like protein
VKQANTIAAFFNALGLKRLKGLRLLFLFSLLFFGPKAKAQNLVKNPSFEETNNWREQDLRSYPDSFPGVKDWFTPLNDNVGYVLNSQAVIFNSHSFLFFPRTDSAHGVAQIGANSNGQSNVIVKTFLQTKLKTPLDSGCSYTVGMYYFFNHVSYFQFPGYDTLWTSANRLGMHLSATRIRDQSDTDALGRPQVFAFDNQNIQPQVEIPFSGNFYMDTTQYTLVEDIVVSEGGEEYLTIGNFYPLSQTFSRSFHNNNIYFGLFPGDANRWRSMAYIDDVFVIPLPPADSLLQTSQDSLICRGDSLTLQASSPNPAYQFLWDNGDTASSRVVDQPGTYWVKLLCACTETLVDTFHIREVAPLTWTAALSDTLLCAGEEIALPLDPKLEYQLNYSPFNDTILRLSQTGSYHLQWTNGCENDDIAFRIDYHPIYKFPVLALDSTICESPEILLPLESLSDSFAIYIDAQKVEPPVFIRDHGDYRLSLVQDCDSMNYDFTIDERGCVPDITIPNAFTPDNNGLNDYFSFEIAGTVNQYDLRIYNRWGELVFQSTDAQTFWDGSYKGAEVSGAFTYVLLITVNDYGQKYSGMVNVIR